VTIKKKYHNPFPETITILTDLLKGKTKILDKIREPINKLNKLQFQKRFIEDRLFATLPNMDSWLVQCFTRLNQMAEKTYGQTS